MATYSVFIKKSAQKEIRNLPSKRLRERIVAAIRRLAQDPHPPGCVKLTGTDKCRLRSGRYRILYTIRDEVVTVTIVRVAHRSTAYR